jgi:hypothetical protein
MRGRQPEQGQRRATEEGVSLASSISPLAVRPRSSSTADVETHIAGLLLEREKLVERVLKLTTLRRPCGRKPRSSALEP